MATVAPKIWTVEEFLALPEDGRRIELVGGRLMIDGRFEDQEDEPMTVRNRFHSVAVIRLGARLTAWLEAQPEPRGEIAGGEAGVRLPLDPPEVVGVDVAYFTAEVMAAQGDDSTLIEGVPLMAAEVQSPNDTLQQTRERVQLFQRAGVPLVWMLNPYDRTVTIYRPGQTPVLVGATQELDGGGVLPGFRAPVDRLFL